MPTLQAKERYDARPCLSVAVFVQILLGYKKRGFGRGLWNGFGGKVDSGETFLQAACRELEEEAGITAPLEHRGTIFFKNADTKEAAHIEVFYADEYSGSIMETDEMRPQWFSIDADAEPSNTTSDLQPIPFGQMWEEDPMWFPLMLSKRPFAGRVDFGPDGRLRKWWFAEVPAATLIST
ncbi:uncharacterized protein FIBRA_03276 [Fibroporia radiculosa]|uniref:Oxidized purine nucleoside triphosphate hydrolase n=1 Tax=Fibroporia radiculosa TaxID=599839 RepID=J4G4U3_9APHY|nr:uncharacterized protein FIBRA_03276 [Fibroporia radiculosa]CCM01228.1 predicted protein [Fibroporia radiculosa]